MYKTCRAALIQVSKIDDTHDNIPQKGEILSDALKNIKSDLDKAKNGIDWKKWNRSLETSSFYSKIDQGIKVF